MQMIDDDEDFDRLETEELSGETVLPRRRQSGFGYCLDACGLSTEEAMAYFGLSRSAIEKKRIGTRPMTPEEGHAFAQLWHGIRLRRFEDLPDGAKAMAAAMVVLTGRHVPKNGRRGRKPIVPVDEADGQEARRKQVLAATTAAVQDAVTRQKEKREKRREETVDLMRRAADGCRQGSA